MPKLAVVSLAIGDYYQRLSEITFPTIRRYAEKIGAEFIAITGQKIAETPHWEKFQLLDYLGVYDRILYLDADVLIRKCCPNIFDIVPEMRLGLFNEAPFAERGDAIERCADEYNCRDFKWDGKYYNTGVMVLSRCHRLIFRKPEREISNFCEQSFINLEIQRQKPPIQELDYKFNRMSCIDKTTGFHRYGGYIIHYAGPPNRDQTASIAKDLAAIETLPDDYESPKHVWFHVQGGLGDQMQAEPAIRFATEHVWPGADIRVSTHFPELFAHLPVRAAKHEIPIWERYDSEPFTRGSTPGPESLQWNVVSIFLSHTVDYCSIALISRILPDIDKTYHLKVEPKAKENVLSFAKRADFSDCVLVHAGRHWESKTFPVEWWQAVLDGIIGLGLTPILIGKDDERHGVLKLDGRDRSIDLTNLLTTSEFIAIISLVPILISNDSSPMHLAGAFDNWIILIPTCKHPDLILPYRNGTKSYKTAALYKRLALDDMFTSDCEMGGFSRDSLKGPWENYLPEVQTVLDKIKEIKKL